MFKSKEVIIKMIKKIFLIGAMSVIICSILLISKVQNSNIATDISEPPILKQDDKFNYKTEGVEGKVSIENVTIEGGTINFQIKNLATDNMLVSAYLEYVRLENGEEKGHYPMDCDILNIPANDISNVLSFNPQKPLGKEGIIRVKVLVFENEEDNYNAPSIRLMTERKE